VELSALETLRAVVEHGGVRPAAERLHTVQSNVTARIKRLEQELGVPLFAKRGRRLEPTPGGKVLLEYAERMLLLERQATQAVRQAGNTAGELRLGANETFVALNLPSLLSDMQRHHPGVEVKLTLATSAQLVQEVLAYRLDCAFVGGPVDHPELEADEIYRDELVLVDTPDGVSADRLVVFPEGCAYRARAEQWQRNQGRPTRPLLEFGTLDGILGCVAAGLGVTLMPREAVQRSPHRDRLRLRRLPPDQADAPILLVRRVDGYPLAAIETVRRLSQREQVPPHGATGPA